MKSGRQQDFEKKNKIIRVGTGPSSRSRSDTSFVLTMGSMSFGTSALLDFEQRFYELEQQDRERVNDTSKGDFSTRAARRGSQEGLNRYVDAIPYDHTLVVPPGGEYLNASRIGPGPWGQGGKQSFVATQAPLPWTFADFFNAIVADQTRLLVNLTNLQENGMVKANQYWPAHVGNKLRAGPWEVTLQGVRRPDCAGWEVTQRELKLSPVSGNQPAHHITQLHITSWPDFGAQGGEAYERLLHCIQELQTSLLGERGGEPPPIWMHCSAGLGRTGVVVAGSLALDYLALAPTLTVPLPPGKRQETDEELAIRLIAYLRSCRPRMVQGMPQALMILDFIRRQRALPNLRR